MTVNITKVTSIGDSISRSTTLLAGDVRKSIQVDTIYRSQTIRQKTELLRIRENTYSKLSDGLKQNRSGGGIGGIIEWLIGGEVLRRGGGGLLRRLRGGGPGGGGRITFGKGSGPKFGGGLGLLRRGGGGRILAKAGLKRIPFLDVAFGAMEYGDRRNLGQTQGQAIGGALAQTGGSIGGGLIGQALIPVPVLGYVIGSLIGSAVTTTIFDKVSGVDKLKSGAEVRRISEEQRLADKPSLFGQSLDKFDSTLDRFAATVPTILKRKSLVSDLVDDFPPDLLTPPKPPKPGNPFGAGEVALDVLSIGLMLLSLADNVIGLWGTEVPAAANLVIRLRKYRRVLEFLGLMKKRHGKTFVRSDKSSTGKKIKKKFVKRDKDGDVNWKDVDLDEEELLRRIREGELKFDELSEAITNQQLEQLLGLRKGITKQPNLRKFNENQSVPQFKTGGQMEVDVPLSGAIVPLELHGKETVTVVPEGKKKRSRDIIVLMGTKSRSRSSQMQVPVGSSNGGGVMVVKTNPYEAATKYSKMIGQLTT